MDGFKRYNVFIGKRIIARGIWIKETHEAAYCDYYRLKHIRLRPGMKFEFCPEHFYKANLAGNKIKKGENKNGSNSENVSRCV